MNHYGGTVCGIVASIQLGTGSLLCIGDSRVSCRLLWADSRRGGQFQTRAPISARLSSGRQRYPSVKSGRRSAGEETDPEQAKSLSKRRHRSMARRFDSNFDRCCELDFPPHGCDLAVMSPSNFCSITCLQFCMRSVSSSQWQW